MKFDLFSAFQEFLASQRENILLWVAVFLGVGSAIYFGLNNEPSAFTTAGAFSGCVFLFVAMFRLYQKKHDSISVLCALIFAGCLVSVATGFTASHIKTDFVATPMLNRETRPVMVEGTLDHREDQEGKKGTLLFLSDLKIEKYPADKTPVKIRITTRKPTDARAGDRVKFLAKLTPLSPPVAPDAYDFARHYYFESIGALGYALSNVEVLQNADEDNLNLENIRTSISKIIFETVPMREAGIVSALMTGERAAIDDADWDALRASGLAHIISISGLHVAMVAAPVFFIVRFCLALFPFIALRLPIKKIAAFVALIVCCLYVGLVVPSVPTTRALLMTGVALMAIMLDRSPFSLRLVALSAILVLLVSPESIWSVSFQMSFAAVTALVAVAEAMRPVVSTLYADAGWIKKGLLFIGGVLMTSTIASIATAPFSLYHFQQVASYSVLANALSVPISGIMIMPMVIVSFLLIPLGMADWSLKILGKGVEWLLDIARWTQDLPGALVTAPTQPFLFLLCIVLMGGCFILFCGRLKYFVSIIFFGGAILSLMFFVRPAILVSEDGEVMAVRAENTVYLSNKNKDKFAVTTWLKNWDVPRDNVKIFPRNDKIILNDKGDFIACDGAGCRIQKDGHEIVYSKRLYELRQDCDWADIVVSPTRLSRHFCGGKYIIQYGYYELRRQKGFALSFVKNELKIKTVQEVRGERPWSATK